MSDIHVLSDLSFTPNQDPSQLLPTPHKSSNQPKSNLEPSFSTCLACCWMRNASRKRPATRVRLMREATSSRTTSAGKGYTLSSQAGRVHERSTCASRIRVGVRPTTTRMLRLPRPWEDRAFCIESRRARLVGTRSPGSSWMRMGMRHATSK